MNGMTGYSYRELYHENAYIYTELKSLNSRYLDINLNLPNYLNSMDIKIRDLLKNKLNRGKIDAFVSIKLKDNLNEISANLSLAEKYAENLQKIIDHFNLKDDLRLFHLTKYDDILSIDRKRDYDKYWNIISKCLSENISEVLLMKKKEGDVIKKDLLLIIKRINKNVKVIAKNVSRMEKEIFENTKSKIGELLKDCNIDEARILNETAVLVSKSCINEEITRLNSHTEHFISILEEKEDVGKRLDFLCQEMHREINTIGSKITLAELTGNVISVKNDIEKLREQIRNAE